MANPKTSVVQTDFPQSDCEIFDAFQKGITEASTDIPGYFFDVLEENFHDLLA